MNPVLYIGLCIAAAYCLAVVLGRFVVPWLRKLKYGQEIREIGPKWHQSKSGTPTMGGIIFMLASLACVGFGFPARLEGEFTHVLVLALALGFGIVGFLDDYIKVKKKRNLGLTSLQKLLAQIVVGSLFLAALYATDVLSCDLWIPFTDVRLAIHPVIFLPICLLVMLGTVNAVNLTDGVDGLATGVTIPVMAFFTVTAFLMGKADLALFPAALMGALAGFLWYNLNPAKTFMGDTGSLFLGGAVCGMALALDMPLILLIVGLIYVVETLSVILQVSYFKLTHGKRLFKMSPIHHHFEMCGWSEYKIWFVFVGITVAMCVLAYFGVFGF